MPKASNKRSRGPARPTSKTRPASKTKPPRRAPAPAPRRGPVIQPLDMEETLRARELFWANVIREILCSIAEEGRKLAAAAGQPIPPPACRPADEVPPPPLEHSTLPPPGPGDSADSTGSTGSTDSAGHGPGGENAPPSGASGFLDGRLAVITTFGERIPIAEVRPLFAVGVDRSPQTRALSMAVECSVFQIRTPKGTVYTLPIHEIRGVRAISEELMNEIENFRRGDGAPERPFGFAAFTSLARAGLQQPGELPTLAEEGWGE